MRKIGKVADEILARHRLTSDFTRRQVGELLVDALELRDREHATLREEAVREARREAWQDVIDAIEDDGDNLAVRDTLESWIERGSSTIPHGAPPASTPDPVEAMRARCEGIAGDGKGKGHAANYILKRIAALKNEGGARSPWNCQHANEVPRHCPCADGCYCKLKTNTCDPDIAALDDETAPASMSPSPEKPSRNRPADVDSDAARIAAAAKPRDRSGCAWWCGRSRDEALRAIYDTPGTPLLYAAEDVDAERWCSPSCRDARLPPVSSETATRPKCDVDAPCNGCFQRGMCSQVAWDREHARTTLVETFLQTDRWSCVGAPIPCVEHGDACWEHRMRRLLEIDASNGSKTPESATPASAPIDTPKVPPAEPERHAFVCKWVKRWGEHTQARHCLDDCICVCNLPADHPIHTQGTG